MKQMILILALFLAFPSSGDAKKRALLVGISKYRANGRTAWGNIHGKEDVDSLDPALTKKGFAVTTLVNEQATYQGITNSLKRLILETKKGDIVFIHFSCHGQPVEDGLLKGYPKDENDGYDEAIVPIDAGKEYSPNGYKGEKHLIDDELNGYIKSLQTKIGPKGLLYVTIDACHAGKMYMGGLESMRGTKEALASKPMRYNPPENHISHYKVKKGTNLSPVLFIEACRSYQRNSEIRVRGKEFGSLSYHIWQTIESMPRFERNALEFKKKVDSSIKQKGPWPKDQDIVFESNF